ncbi:MULTISPECIES: superoxide dismutase family protein [Kitasatospora]|uniref:Superoxide dismutase n=1 Tax=Kitasatospora cystarginea TaxID=58350 RepID=A0ABN3EFA8_9ACTN
MSAPLAASLLPLALLHPALPHTTEVDADFAPASAFVPPTAISHAPDLVRYGSHVRVTVVRATDGTTVRMELSGAAAQHGFPVHAHTGRCGADPAASGPHYQHSVDPVQPSTDLAYANDRNELRMTLRTDRAGNGSASATVRWAFRPGEASSLVLHAGAPADSHAASDRVACVNVAF